MFWRFGFQGTSAIVTLLEKDGVTLDDIMVEDELLQEVKAKNVKLLDFLSKPTNLAKLLGYITADDLDEARRFKFPFVTAEIFGCDVYQICDSLLSNQEILISFWTLMDKPAPLNPLQASYFAKINAVLLTQKTAAFQSVTQTIAFLRSQANTVQRLLKHVGSSSIAELILKLISVEDLPEGTGIVKWLSEEGLISHLFSQLDPHLDPEIHTTASQTLTDIINISYQSLVPPEQMNAQGQPIDMQVPTSGNAGNLLIDQMKRYNSTDSTLITAHIHRNRLLTVAFYVIYSKELLSRLVGFMLDRDAPNSTSSLTNGIGIIMELIRKYCRSSVNAVGFEIEHAEIQQHEYQLQLQAGRAMNPFPTPEKLNTLSCDMNDLLQVISGRLVDFVALLHSPKSVKAPTDTTVGKQFPLGSERLKICELFAEILHLHLVNHFFTFKWNNFLHSVVYDMIAKVFNTFSFTSAAPQVAGTLGQPPAAGEAGVEGGNVPNPDANLALTVSQRKMKELRVSVKKLIVSIFKEAKLMSLVTDAQRQNDYDVEQPRGVRLGYMGHLTYISDEICKLFERCSAELDDELRDYIASEEWQEYVSHALRETRDRDREPLGGTRPEAAPAGMGFAGSTLNQGSKFGGDESDFGSKSSRKKAEPATKDVSDDEDDAATGNKNVPAESDTFSDQFARFLCQQLVKGLPSRFLGGDSSDDDDEADKQCFGELEDKDVNFDIGEAINMDNQFAVASGAREPDEDTMSDDNTPGKGGDDEEGSAEDRNANSSENVSSFAADFDGAFNTRDLERALDSVTLSTNVSASSSVTADWADFGTLAPAPPGRKKSVTDVE
eukprot:jgi/Hompol1/6202/HPOL_004872-RA